MLIRTLSILIILFIIDLYVFQGIRFLVRNSLPLHSRIIYVLFWSVTAICFTILIAGMFVDWHDWPKALRTYSFAFIFVTYFSKLFLVLFLVIDDLFRLFRWVAGWISSFGDETNSTNKTSGKHSITRSGFLVRLGFVIAAIPFALARLHRGCP